jgi:hypothetical protein
MDSSKARHKRPAMPCLCHNRLRTYRNHLRTYHIRLRTYRNHLRTNHNRMDLRKYTDCMHTSSKDRNK